MSYVPIEHLFYANKKDVNVSRKWDAKWIKLFQTLKLEILLSVESRKMVIRNNYNDVAVSDGRRMRKTS